MKINYLRVSLTDLCNLRCIYCMGKEGVRKIPHREILTFEEIARFLRLAAKMGIEKVRITGGEPLVRKDAVALVKMVSRIAGIKEVALTTNGVRFGEYAKSLKEAGVSRINISLDTLERTKFSRITRRNSSLFDKVQEGIAAAEKEGFPEIKINMVVMKGINDDEVIDFVRLTRERPLTVRFIEYLPFFGRGEKKWHVPNSDIRFLIEKRFGKLTPALREQEVAPGPAQEFCLAGFCGKVGFISALSEPFCRRCNRLRLTSDGKLYPCLLDKRAFDIKDALRGGCADDEIKDIFAKTRAYKSCLPRQREGSYSMAQIGG